MSGVQFNQQLFLLPAPALLADAALEVVVVPLAALLPVPVFYVVLPFHELGN